MPDRNVAPRPGRGVVRLLRNQRGVAVVEFALLLPFMVFLFLTTFDALHALLVAGRTSIAVNTIAEMMSQNDSTTTVNGTTVPVVTDSDLTLAFDSIPTTFPDVLTDAGAQQVGWQSDVTMIVSGAFFTGLPAGCTAGPAPARTGCTSVTAKIGWSLGNNSSKRACGAIAKAASDSVATVLTKLPPDLYFGSNSFIVVDLTYSYKPLFATWITGPIAFHRVAYLPPRFFTSLGYTTGGASPITSATAPTCGKKSTVSEATTPALSGCVCTT